MKKLLILPLLIILFSMTPVKKTKIVFFGDSITQAAVNKDGYIDRIQTNINTKNVQDNYELLGAGISGNKIYDLYLRIEEDVLAKKPDVVVIYIGINDVWHKASSGTGTDKDKYEKFYTAIIKKLQAQNIKVFLCTPTVIGELKDDRNQQDGDLNSYSDVIRQLAKTYNCTLIDLRNAFLNYETQNNTENKASGILTTDRVHLNKAGNELVATEMMKALGI
ncbi:MAG: GDSL-type esterase/lipase family protein [Chitinophagaceae bacterium]